MNNLILINNDDIFVEIFKEGNIHKILWDKQKGTLQIDVGNSIVRVCADDIKKPIQQIIEEIREFANYGGKSSTAKNSKSAK